MLTEVTTQLAHLTPCTDAEGPGKRFAVWFQGCPLRCPGCCNPEFLPFRGGRAMTHTALTEAITTANAEHDLEGITLLGGEPFAHAAAGAAVARHARSLGLTVMIFTGYFVEDLRGRPDPETADLLAHTDILVDGPYDREQPDADRRWIGSRNQRVHFLSDRVSADDPRWQKRNTLEIRVDRHGISVNGFPAKSAVGLWKGWQRKPHRS